jgi:hypothetical protein
LTAWFSLLNFLSFLSFVFFLVSIAEVNYDSMRIITSSIVQ